MKMTPPLQLLLTHPGGAHKDDFLACCVLLAEAPVPIERREPEASDLEDPTIAIIDVGHQHEPARSNFDHHQFPPDQTPTCSLSLVLQHLGLYEDAKLFCDWLEPAEWFDCRGPNETARRLEIDRDTLAKLNSPIDIALLRRFALEQRLEPSHPLWEIMRMIGQDLVGYLRGLRERLEFIETHSKILDLRNESGASRQFLYIPRTNPLPEEPSAGLGQYLKAHGLEESIVGSIYPDRRSNGYGISRYNDHPGLDFTRIAEEPDVHFAHKSGFLAKTSATELERLKQLATLSLK